MVEDGDVEWMAVGVSHVVGWVVVVVLTPWVFVLAVGFVVCLYPFGSSSARSRRRGRRRTGAARMAPRG